MQGELQLTVSLKIILLPLTWLNIITVLGQESSDTTHSMALVIYRDFFHAADPQSAWNQTKEVTKVQNNVR